MDDFDTVKSIQGEFSPLAGMRSMFIETQILRVLLCTARLWANSPGGLRFKPGSRPWLTTLTQCRLTC